MLPRRQAYHWQQLLQSHWHRVVLFGLIAAKLRVRLKKTAVGTTIMVEGVMLRVAEAHLGTLPVGRAKLAERMTKGVE